MALTVIIALAAAFVLSLTFVPAMIAIAIIRGTHCRKRRTVVVRWMKALYEPALRRAIDHPSPFIAAGVALLLGGDHLLYPLGQVFIPTLDEKNIDHERRAHSERVAFARSQAMHVS